MFRWIASIFLLIAFTAQTFDKVFIVFDYYINTASFAKNCENKKRPVMRCHGKCQMMKKIKEQEKKEQQKPELKFGNKNEVLSSKSMFATISCYRTHHYSSFSTYFNTSIPKGVHPDIFHPPAMA